MADLQINFDEAEMADLNKTVRKRNVGQQKVGYDAEELRPLSAKTHNVYKDMRTAFPASLPSLSLYALRPYDPDTGSMTRENKQRLIKFIFETLGTLIFVWFVIFSVWVKTDVQQGSLSGFPYLLSIQSLYTGWIQAFGLGLALVTCGYFSGEFNSTYTLVTSFFPRPDGSTPGGSTSIGSGVVTGLIKILGQHLGAFLGALLAYVVLGADDYPGSSPGSTSGYGIPGVPGHPDFGFGFAGVQLASFTLGQAFVFEMLGTFMLGLLMMIIQFNPPGPLSKFPQLTLPFTLLALVTFGCPITGAVFNWARYFGQAIVALIGGGSFGVHWWVYLLAPLAGHVLDALAYIFIFRY